MHIEELKRIKNLPQLFARSAKGYAQQKSFLTKDKKNKQFDGPTYAELYQQGIALASFFIDKLKIPMKMPIGLIADNRLEWMQCNYAIQLCGAITVPRGTDITDFEINFILNQSEIQICIVENAKMAQRVIDLRENLNDLTKVILIEGKAPAPIGRIDFYSLAEALKVGEKIKQMKVIEDRVAQIESEEVFTILYTSGTTGQPKGVMLTHKNMLSQMINTPFVLDYKTEQLLSILPIWHAFELVVEILAIRFGVTTAYTNIRDIREDLQLIKPTFMASAPRLWENIYNGLIKRVHEGPIVKRLLFQAATFSAGAFFGAMHKIKNEEMRVEKRQLADFFKVLQAIILLILSAFPYLILDSLVFKKVRAALGGRLTKTISGGGALPMYIDLFFNHLGIKVLEGYGLTETSPVVACRTEDHLIIGTIGRPLKNTEIWVKSVDDQSTIYRSNTSQKEYGKAGVLYTRGPQVMKGYYKNPQETHKVLSEDNWLNTGDIAMVVIGGSIKLIGRMKDTIVLSNGENIEPIPIENALVQSPYIHQCMLIGQDEKYLSALIVVAKEKFELKDLSAANDNKKIRDLIKEQIQQQVHGNPNFKKHERIIQFYLLPKEFEVGDELTAAYKTKRQVIVKKYQKIIKDLYK